jgi:drug/metabolite transporter (DMT)-like permease
MAAALALLSALLYGAADFSGGSATRRNPVFAVMALSQGAGMIVALVAAPLVGGAPRPIDMGWGLLAGLAGSAGLALLYEGLASHLTAVVSPLSALVGAVLPAAFGAALGERPAPLAIAGAGLCLPAILLLSWDSRGARDRARLKSSLGFGALSGTGFGLFFILVSRSSPASGLWPLVASRAASLICSIGLLLALGRKGGRTVAAGDRRLVLFAGTADMGANVCFLVASRSGLLMLVTLITSLYPAPTVALARIFQGQRVGVPRAAGIALAVAGAALIGLK